MRKYSPFIWLLAVITAMVIFQIGEMDVDAASSTPSSQTLQMNRQPMTGPALMVPMDTRLAKDKGDDKDSDDDKTVGESEKKEDKPDLRTVDWSKASSAKKGNGNGNGNGDEEEKDEEEDDEDKEDEEEDEGGFDRLWDVVTNG